MRALIELRDTARSLIAAEAESLDDSPELDQARDRLAMLWCSYVARYGPINRFNPRRSGRTDPETGEEDPASRVVPPAGPAGDLLHLRHGGVGVGSLRRARPNRAAGPTVAAPADRASATRPGSRDRRGRAGGGAGQLGPRRHRRDRRPDGAERPGHLPNWGIRCSRCLASDQWQTRAHYLGDVRIKLDQARAAEAESPGHYSGRGCAGGGAA